MEGLSAQPSADRIEVLAVGDVDSVARDAALPFALHLIPCPERHANARRNLAIARAAAPRVAFLDDDTVPREGWLEAALAVDPEVRRLVTGPEEPLQSGATPSLVYAVTSHLLAEGTRAHVNPRDEAVDWTEAPFCNLVLPARVFREVGLPSTDIPWDMDDFEFCRRARTSYEFWNDPRLRVRHDRYPDSVRRWLGYKWRQRVRIGEKLVSHAHVYARIPGVVAVALAPWIALLALLVLRPPPSLLLAAGAVAYGLLLALQLPHASRSLGLRGVPGYLALVFAVHVLTIVGVQVGLARGLLGRLRGRPPMTAH